MRDYIAVDIGASSGRLMLGRLIKGSVELEEIHRFKNGFSIVDGHERWNVDMLLVEIFLGLEKAKAKGVSECSIGIDTWAVDYVLLDSKGEKLNQPISYRDKRTVGVIDSITKKMSKSEIYRRTGIQFLELNTLCQLYSESEEQLSKTSKIMFIPDYISYILTGNSVTELTNASTSQLLNIETRDFDEDLLNLVGISKTMFGKLVEPGTIIGDVLPQWRKQYDIPMCSVVSVATHDTASAIVGVPANTEDWAYLSSGTWSLIGMENSEPNTSEQSYINNFTNEWGFNQSYRFLKNIMGLWLVQEVAREFEYKYSYSEMATLADKTTYYQSIIDVNDSSFNNPSSMVEAIQEYCRLNNQVIPTTVGELTNCIYSSLSLSYSEEISRIEKITNKTIKGIYVVGGGSNIHKLNQLTADLTNKIVYSGPSEATAVGNIVVQMLSRNDMEDLNQARSIINQSFDIQTYYPKEKGLI